MIRKLGNVNLSSYILGESFIEHQIKIGLDRFSG